MVRILWISFAWASADPVEVWVGAATEFATLPELSVHLLQREASASRREDCWSRGVGQHHMDGTDADMHMSSSSILYVFVGFLVLVILCCVLSFWCFGDGDHLQKTQTSVASTKLPPTSRPSTSQPVNQPGNQLGDQPVVMTPPRSTYPPPICASLILPHTEARFMVDSTTFHSNTIPIMGTSGRQLLQSYIIYSNMEKVLRVASLRCEEDPRVSIHAAPASRGKVMQIKGRHGVSYGTMQETLPGTFAVYSECEMVMTITQDDLNHRPFEMSIKDGEGTLIAVAGTNVASGPDPQEHMWRVTVKPAVDAVLVIACALAVIVVRDP